MSHELRLRLHLPILMIIPALLIEIIQLPAQSQEGRSQESRSQESIQVAQVLDSPSPQVNEAGTVAKNFFTLLAQQQYEQAGQYLSPSLTADGSATQLQQLWQNLLGTTGNFDAIQQVYPTGLLGDYTVLVTIGFEKSIEDFVVKLDSNQKITAVDFPQVGDIQTNAEKFVDAITQGDYSLARSYLSPDLKQQFLPETIQQRWQAILAKLGPFKQRTTAKVVEANDYEAVLVNLEFAQYSGGFLIFFNPLGEITGIQSPLTPQQQQQQ